MKKICWFLGLALVAGCATQRPQGEMATASRPWMNTSLSPERRAALMAQHMTLDEKISQIHMMDVRDHPREVVGIPRLGVAPFKYAVGYRFGTFLFQALG